MSRHGKSVVVILALVAAVLLGGLGQAMAQTTTTWNLPPEDGAGDWFSAVNWGNGVPVSTKEAHVENGGTAVIATGDATALSLWSGSFGNSSGTVSQTGGALTLSATTNSMMLGLYESDNGYYNLSGGSLYSQQAVVGASGYGQFHQSGDSSIHQVAQVLTIGQSAGGVGQYTLAGGSLQTNSTTVGDAGTGTFTQTGGTHTVTTGLSLGLNVLGQTMGYTGKGTYNLEGGSLVAGGEAVNNGEFLQKVGTTNTVGQWLMVSAVGGEAKYTLEGGTLTTVNEKIGGTGAGTFTQTGGDHQVTGTTPGQGLMVGGGPTSSFNLEGGTLEAYNVGVGPGEFRQLAGTTNTIGNQLTVSTNEDRPSKYTLDGGVLNSNNITVGLIGHGEFLQKGESALTVAKGMNIGNSSNGVGQYTLAGGSLSFKSLAGLTLGFQGAGTFTQSGGNVSWTPYWDSATNAANTLTLGQSGGTGTYYLQGTGTLTMDGREIVGADNGQGNFIQSGGTNAVNRTLNGDYSRLIVGWNNAVGTYQLSGGLLTVDGNEIVGQTNNNTAGTGHFIQSGGTNIITKTLAGADGGRLIIGSSGSLGSYELSAGQLSMSGKEIIGWTNTGTGGTGTFIQSGGTNAITTYTGAADGGRLLVGWDKSVGTYHLTDGLLTVDGKEFLGGASSTSPLYNSGNGTFIQDGGTNTITMKSGGDGYGRLVVGWYDNSVGAYTLNKGKLQADRVTLGYDDSITSSQPYYQPQASGQGTLTVNGGSLVVKQLRVGLAADQGQGGFGSLNLASQDAYVEVSESFTIGPTGIFTAVPGATIHMTGTDFIVSSTTPENLAGLANLKLVFTGGPKATDTFQVPFEVGSVEVGPDSHVQFVDTCNITNLILDPKAVLDFIDHDGNPGNEVITVDNLILKDIPDIRDLDPQDLNNIHYTNVSYVTSPVPLPGAVWLLGTGLMGLGAVGWRRKRG